MSVERILIAYCPGFMLALFNGKISFAGEERSHRIISFCTGKKRRFQSGRGADRS